MYNHYSPCCLLYVQSLKNSFKSLSWIVIILHLHSDYSTPGCEKPCRMREHLSFTLGTPVAKASHFILSAAEKKKKKEKNPSIWETMLRTSGWVIE